jgi:hypothetical protein
MLFSPISRHIIHNYLHYSIFIIHDLSACLTLVLFLFLFNIPKTKIHAFIGKYCIIPLSITIISGFLLIQCKLDSYSITNKDKDIYAITLFTQGTNIMLISINAFTIKIILKYKYLLYLLVYLHIYDLFCGIKSFIFLLNIIVQSNKKEQMDLALELLTVLTIPQIINEIFYIYIHYKYYITNYIYFIWKYHHKISIIFLIYMSLPSILFSIAHDDYWFYSNIYLTNVYKRITFMLVPLIFFLYKCKECIIIMNKKIKI